MQTVSFDSSGIPLSVLGFGTGGLLRVPRRQRQNTLAAALASGITHFDTAPIYGLGESERELGQFLRGRRAQLTLTTKFGLQVAPNAARFAGLQRVARAVIALAPGLRRAVARRSSGLYAAPSFTVDSVRASLERSLQALGTDHVDLFLAHECSASALPSAELIGFLQDLRRSGKIREFGIAASFGRTCAVVPARPELVHVLQFESDAFDDHIEHVRRIAPSVSASALLITHGALAHSVERVRAFVATNPVMATQFHARTAVNLRDPVHAGRLLLRAALLANPRGVVLMQSRSPARIEANARAATSAELDDPVRLLRTLVRERSVAA
jgi:D-threo-aldose 1-dehydrogenase